MGAFKEICIEMGWLELEMLPPETSTDQEFTTDLPLFAELMIDANSSKEELYSKPESSHF